MTKLSSFAIIGSFLIAQVDKVATITPEDVSTIVGTLLQVILMIWTLITDLKNKRFQKAQETLQKINVKFDEVDSKTKQNG
jgi:hypothetical protein